jgi:UDP-N-acetylmuramoylalanine--D-glutamate ligase
MDLKQKKIAILGIGNENIALIKYLKKHNISNLTLCDKEGEISDLTLQIGEGDYKFKLGEDYLSELKNFDLVFRTPGLPYLNSQIQDAKTNGVEISSQIKLFFELCPCPIIGITGTKGKGTTSTLIYEILKREFETNQKSNIYLAGNIGNAPIEFLDKLTEDDIVVLELSSFQLQDLEKSPHIAVVLNISSDHLDVHKSNEEYVEAKTNLVRHQKQADFAVINADYLTSFQFAAITQAKVFWFSRRKSVDFGCFIAGDTIVLRIHENDHELAKTGEILLRGEHNLENICAASIAGFLAGAKANSIKEVLKTFKGLEHRLELVGKLNGISFYNDSFSTNPDTAIAAIKSFSEPIVLIAGGSEKFADYQELGSEIDKSTIKTLVLIGETGPRIKKEIKNKNIKIIDQCQNLSEVMEAVKNEAASGDVVLLSPASASFDWFKNYKDRGNQFKEQVKNLYEKIN